MIVRKCLISIFRARLFNQMIIEISHTLLTEIASFDNNIYAQYVEKESFKKM